MKTLFQAEQIIPVDSLVDSTNNRISSVSMITVGPALGHGMMIDETTLEQVKACAESYPGGLKVIMNHDGGVDQIVGYLTGFHITNDRQKLLADLNLIETSEHRAYILEIATKIPGSFGMSIAFSGVPDIINGVPFARCSEIYSCDIVSEPAANPSGLFSRRFDAWQKDKEGNAPISAPAPKSKTNMNEEILAQIGKIIDDKIASCVASFDAKLAELKKDSEKSCSRIEEVAKLSTEAADKAALAAVKEFSKTLGQPAGSAAQPSAPAPEKVDKKFEQIVKEHPEYSKSKKAALSAVIKSNPGEYADYRARCQSGEIILF